MAPRAAELYKSLLVLSAQLSPQHRSLKVRGQNKRGDAIFTLSAFGMFFFFLPLLKLAPLSPKPPSCHGITRRQHATSLQQEKHPTKSRV